MEILNMLGIKSLVHESMEKTLWRWEQSCNIKRDHALCGSFDMQYFDCLEGTITSFQLYDPLGW